MIVMFRQTNHCFVVLVALVLLQLFSPLVVVVTAKELVATHEWQRVGPGDTLPAGLEIRMDMEHGGSWARLPPEEQPQQEAPKPHAHRCGPSCHERLARRRGLRGAAAAAASSSLNLHAMAAPSAPTTTSLARSDVMAQRILWVLSVVIVGIMICKSRGPKLREL